MPLQQMHSVGNGTRRGVRGRRAEQQNGSPELDLVAICQFVDRDGASIHEGSVRAVAIPNRESLVAELYGGVHARHFGVVKADFVLNTASHGDGLKSQLKPDALFRPLNDEE